MQYAVWIALAVVALAIVPPILKNRRNARDQGGDGAIGDGAGSSGSSDGCDGGSDGGGSDGGGCD